MKNERWLDARRFERERYRHAENGSRQATCFVTYTVTGAGQTIVNAAEPFHTPFFGEPSVAFGFELVVSPDLEFYQLPRITGGVFRWEVESADRFVGVFPYFTVDVPLLPGVFEGPSLNDVVVIGHLTFTGLSYKALGTRVPSRLADAAIPPRPMPYVP